jgi:hypothetical protein
MVERVCRALDSIGENGRAVADDPVWRASSRRTSSSGQKQRHLVSISANRARFWLVGRVPRASRGIPQIRSLQGRMHILSGQAVLLLLDSTLLNKFFCILV